MPFNQDRERQMFTATCGECGNECQIPFNPTGDRPVYCRECFQNHKPERSGSRFGGRSSFGRRPSYGGRSRDDRGSRYGRGSRDRPRQMFKATCGDCGNECQVPFQPKEERPVYCNDCFQNHK